MRDDQQLPSKLVTSIIIIARIHIVTEKTHMSHEFTENELSKAETLLQVKARQTKVSTFAVKTATLNSSSA